MPVVIAAETFIEINVQTPVFRRSVGKLVSDPVMLPDRDGHVLVQVERRSQSLGEYIHDVIVAIRPIIEIDAKRILPLLCLENVAHVRSVKQETLKVELAHGFDARPSLEVSIEVVADAVLALKESHFRVEIRPDSTMIPQQVEPVAPVVEAAAPVSLAGGEARRTRLSDKSS